MLLLFIERQPCWASESKEEGAACLPDGRFAPVQCHRATGYCWCVTPRGRPIPNTSRKNRKPRCKKRGNYLEKKILKIFYFLSYNRHYLSDYR